MSSDTTDDSLAAHLDREGWDALSSYFLSTSDDALVTVEGVLQRLGGGNSDRVALLFERYLRRMVLLAHRCLRGPRGGADPAEDVVQSVLLSFFGKHQTDAIDTASDDSLWPILVRGTIRHCHKRVKRWKYRASRGLTATSLGPTSAEDSHPGIDPSDDEPPPDDYVAFLDFLQSFRKGLTERQRQIVELRLEGRTQKEVAEQLQMGLATVERELVTIRKVLSAVMGS